MPLLYQPAAMVGNSSPLPAPELVAATRFLRRMLVLVLFSIAACTATLRFVSMAQAAQVVPATTPTVSLGARIASPVPTPPATPATIAAQPCVPFGPIPAPSEVPLTVPGLQQIIDTPQTYTIYGNDSSEITRQLQKCLPSGAGGSFSGATSYWFGNHYVYQITPDAQCQLTDITVGIHVTQVLPSWQNNGNTALAAKWDTFERNLVLHENGHTAINISEARALLGDLQSLPTMPCDQIAVAANAITNKHIAAINVANNNYDRATGHGSLQGATW